MYVALAVFASLLSSMGIVIQSRDPARLPSELSFRLQLLIELLQRPVWLLGLGLSACASIFQIVALTHLPIAFVQPTVAAGVVFVPIIDSAVNGRPFHRSEIAAIAVIVASVIAIAFSVELEAIESADVSLRLLVAAPVVCAIAGRVIVASRPIPGPLLALLAGLYFGTTAILAKVVATAAFGGYRFAIALIAMILFASIGQLAQMSALQVSPPALVAPFVLIVSTVAPVVAAKFVLDERWDHPLIASVALASTVIAAAFLARLERSPVRRAPSTRRARRADA